MDRRIKEEDLSSYLIQSHIMKTTSSRHRKFRWKANKNK